MSTVTTFAGAAGLIVQLARIGHEYGIAYRSDSGFDTTTARYELACQAVAGLRANKRPSVVLHRPRSALGAARCRCGTVIPSGTGTPGLGP